MAVDSKNIIIFPCVSRDIKDDKHEIAVKAKLMSEENITNIVKSITDKNSYLLSYDNGVFKFILDGYYVELTETLSGTKYVQLQKTISGNHTVLKGDAEQEFTGLSIIGDKPETVSGECLCLCVDGKIPKESYLKFDENSITIGYDFGELK